jgi:tetratricopeptide (TPR) repeat protein
MKTILLVIFAAALGFVGAMVIFRRDNPVPVAEVTSKRLPPEKKPETAATVAAITPSPTTREPQHPAETAQPDAATVALATAIDTVTSPQVSFGQKQALWNQLRTAGRLDEVKASLDKLAAENPRDVQVRTALGEAQLQKLRSIVDTGGDPSEVPILGMQADRYFTQALGIEPTNWEAQFMKAAAMAHWPPALNKQAEVIQRLSDLATQQDTMAPQPEFAQTYLILGQQYKAAGQPEKATQTIQLAIAKFPMNPNLVQALADVSKP